MYQIYLKLISSLSAVSWCVRFAVIHLALLLVPSRVRTEFQTTASNDDPHLRSKQLLYVITVLAKLNDILIKSVSQTEKPSSGKKLWTCLLATLSAVFDNDTEHAGIFKTDGTENIRRRFSSTFTTLSMYDVSPSTYEISDFYSGDDLDCGLPRCGTVSSVR